MPINSGDPITAASYNAIRSQLYNLITVEYGYISPTPTRTVNANEIITVDDWRRLYLDINRCKIHQTNGLISGLVEPQNNLVLTANFANTLLSEITALYASKDSVSASQLSLLTLTDARTKPNWNDSPSGISSEVDVVWGTANALTYFLNLGGKVEILLGYEDIVYTGDNATWKSMIDGMNAQLSSYGSFNKSSTNISFLQSSGIGNIEVIFTKTSTKMSFKVVFRLTSAVTITIKPRVFYNLYSSSNTLGPSPFGIPSPTGSFVGVEGLDDIPPTPLVTKILSVSPASLTYSLQAFQTSAEQTITVTNAGSGAVTVSSLETPGATNILALVGGSGTLVLGNTIPAGQSRTIKLSYKSTGATTGSFNTELKILSDNQEGTITIPVVITVTAPQFALSISPTNWIYTATNFNAGDQTFALVPTEGTIIESYNAVLSNTLGAALGLNTSRIYPRVQFDPTNLANGSYSSILTVTAFYQVYASTATATLNLTRNIIVNETKNLGQWISAQSADNSVLGISYDVVQNQKFVTIGFGAGADGVSTVINGGGGFISADNLGISSDQKPDAGPALFKSESNGAYTSFLNTYGVRVRSESFEPLNVEQVRTYKVTVATAGVYNWTFAADDNGYFAIDGVIVSDRRTEEFTYETSEGGDTRTEIVTLTNAYSTNATGSYSLTAGEHTITIGYTNFDGAGAVALRLVLATSPFTELWSTLNPIRTSSPYAFWSEVYRIPLTGAARSYNPSEYPVKNGGYANGNTYSSEMSGGNICTFADDGFGNLTFTFPSSFVTNTPTSRANLYLPWYYIEIASVTRVTQLETPPLPITGSSKTKFFIGFNSQGQVLTSEGAVPRSTSGGGGGGGGGGGPNDPYIPRTVEV